MLQIILLFLFSLTLVSFIQKNKRGTSNDPPQPLQLPLIGGLHLVNPTRPHIDLHNISIKNGWKMFKLWFGKNPIIFIADADLYRDVYVTHYENFSDRPNLPSYNVLIKNYQDLAMCPYDTWKPRREFLASVLSKARLKLLNATMETQMEFVLKKLNEHSQSGEPVNPRLIFRRFTTNVVNSMINGHTMPFEEGLTEGFMGKVVGPIDQLLIRLAASGAFDHIYGLGPLYSLYTKFAGSEVDVILEELKKFYVQHLKTIDRENPRDVLDSLIIEGYSEEIVLNITLDFLVAGSETSATAMEWFVLMMVNYPDIAEKTYNELVQNIGKGNKVTVGHRQSTPYFQAVIREMMRYKTITPLGPLFREAKEDMTLQDYFIPKGSFMMANVYSIHRNEAIYKDADRFIPERFLDSLHSSHWAPFALGSRNCLGMGIAMDEIYVGCATLLLNYKISAHSQSTNSPGCPNILDEEEIFATVVKPKLHLYRFESR